MASPFAETDSRFLAYLPQDETLLEEMKIMLMQPLAGYAEHAGTKHDGGTRERIANICAEADLASSIFIFTDASVPGDTRGMASIAALLSTTLDHGGSEIFVRRLPFHCSSNDAELVAVVVGLSRALHRCCQGLADRHPISKVTVFTDNAAVLDAFRDSHLWSRSRLNRFPRQRELAIGKYFMNELYKLAVDVRLRWSPGHRAIPGNEAVDLAASIARKDERTPTLDLPVDGRLIVRAREDGATPANSIPKRSGRKRLRSKSARLAMLQRKKDRKARLPDMRPVTTIESSGKRQRRLRPMRAAAILASNTIKSMFGRKKSNKVNAGIVGKPTSRPTTGTALSHEARTGTSVILIDDTDEEDNVTQALPKPSGAK